MFTLQVTKKLSFLAKCGRRARLVIQGMSKVTEHFWKRQSTHLVIKPLIVEENIVIEILVSEAPDQLERELSKLSQVVPGQLSLPVVEGKWHGRYLSVLAVILGLQIESMLLNLSVPEWLQNSSSIGA